MVKAEFNLLTNPLVNPPALPYGAPPLSQVREEHFEPALDWAIAVQKQEITAITDNPDEPDFENTIEALEFSGRDIGRVSSIFSFIDSVSTTPELQRLSEDVFSPKLSDVGSDILFNEKLFARVKHVYERRDTLTLTGEQRTLLDNTYKSFAQSGADLPDDKKEQLRRINTDLARVTSLFRKNLTKATGAYEKIIDDAAQLDGVPERALRQYADAAEKAGHPGKWLIRLAPPPEDIFDYATDAALRQEIHKANATRATSGEWDNQGNILEILKLRHEKAAILGYGSHADYILSDRMAESAGNVASFLENNREVYAQAAKKEFEELKAYALATDGVTEIKPWDTAFYARRLREEKFDVDMEAFRPYFELEAVTKGLFEHAERLFDIKIEGANGKYQLLNDEMKAYEVTDNKTGALLGVFYTDYYARPGLKRGGAWMTTFRNGGIENGQMAVPLVLNCCNFAKPVPGQPTLLSPREVTTLFHEFGHGLHGLLGKGRYPSLTGTQVKRDFVELPSQLMENWVMQPEVLNRFARHYQTGATLPTELVDKLITSQQFRNGTAGLRQTRFALLDMAYHTQDPSTVDIARTEEKVYGEKPLTDKFPGLISTGFNHIFGSSVGYSVGYYSYKWAEVLEADIFERFKEKGLYDPETARRLRETIYEKGGSEPPQKLFEDMMGRKPDPAALFRREGLLGDRAGTPPETAAKTQPARRPGPPAP